MEENPSSHLVNSSDIQSMNSHPLMISNNESDVNGTDVQLVKSVSNAVTTHRISVEKNVPTLGKSLGRGSDIEMLQALQDLAQPDQVFVLPPISRFTLNFSVPNVENSYRRLGLRRPWGQRSSKLTCSSPRVAPIINLITESVILVMMWLTCLIVFPDALKAIHTPWFYIVSSLALVIHTLLLTLIILDLVACARCPRPSKSGPLSKDWGHFVINLYGKLFRWPSRNVMGTILLVLPTALVLASFSGCLFQAMTTDDRIDPLLVANYRTLIGLLFSFMFLNCTLFTSFSSWAKSLAALIVCVVSLFLISAPHSWYGLCSTDKVNVWRLFTLPQVSDLVVMNGTTSVLPLWAQSTYSNTVVWEFVVILTLTLILVCLLNREFDINFRLSFHRDFEALQAKDAIGRQKLQADWLLENIIPYYIMDDLRQHSKYSRHIKDAGVLFACISNFSEFYDEQYQGGQEMLRVLNEIFADFEHQLASPKYKNVEKIKTIGACFMVASGLNMIEREHNVEPDEHLWALLDFAQDLINTLDDFNRQMFNFRFELKIGFNIGEVTAGVIGTTKLLYDIWGDTVNVASRMYSTGLKGRIQMAEATSERLKSRYIFEYRGDVLVKGKGTMKTYLLQSRRSDNTNNNNNNDNKINNEL